MASSSLFLLPNSDTVGPRIKSHSEPSRNHFDLEKFQVAKVQAFSGKLSSQFERSRGSLLISKDISLWGTLLQFDLERDSRVKSSELERWPFHKTISGFFPAFNWSPILREYNWPEANSEFVPAHHFPDLSGLRKEKKIDYNFALPWASTSFLFTSAKNSKIFIFARRSS